MAKLMSEGMDDILAELARLQDTDGVADRMILAGADEVKKAWQAEADSRGHRRTGAMIASVGYARAPKKAGDALTIDIYPQGKDRRGVRNAEKAFLLHYGTSRIPGDHWVDAAEEKAGAASQAAMEAVFDEFMKG